MAKVCEIALTTLTCVILVGYAAHDLHRPRPAGPSHGGPPPLRSSSHTTGPFHSYEPSPEPAPTLEPSNPTIVDEPSFHYYPNPPSHPPPHAPNRLSSSLGSFHSGPYAGPPRYGPPPHRVLEGTNLLW